MRQGPWRLPDSMRSNATVALEWVATASPSSSPRRPRSRSRNGPATVSPTSPSGQGGRQSAGRSRPSGRDHPHLHVLTIPLVQKAVAKRGRPAKGSLPLTPQRRPGASVRATWWAGTGTTPSPSRTRTPRRWRTTVCGGAYPPRRPGREQAPARYRAELAALGDSLAARAASLDDRERTLARKAAVLDAVRREAGLSPSPALADIASERPRPLRGAIDPRPKDRGLRD